MKMDIAREKGLNATETSSSHCCYNSSLHRHQREKTQDKKHSYYVLHSFFGLKLAVICFLLLFASIGVAGATVSYNATENLIYLDSGTNTLASMYSDISNASVLDYNAGTNTYTLSANISGKIAVTAHLVLNDTTLSMNQTRLIKTWANLTISNITIQAKDTSYTWKIWSYARYTDYTVSIADSDISGGHILVQPNGFQEPITPISITNNYFHDYTCTDATECDEGTLNLWNDAGVNATITNNTFENIHLTAGSYNGIIKFTGYDGITIDGFYVNNCSVNSYGMTFFYGDSAKYDPATITNFEIKDCTGGDAITGKEWGSAIISNGTITNISRDAIHFYYSPSFGHMDYLVQNVNIDGAGRKGITCNGYSDNYTVDIYNTTINNTVTAYWVTGPTTFYITNSKATNYTNWNGYYGEIREYELVDIYVIDGNSNAVEGATVTIEAINPDVDDCIITRNLESLTQTETLSSGHTPLPEEDKDKTIALLMHRTTPSSDKTYSYNITASKGGKTASMSGLYIDESWYRQDPDKPTKTVVCNIDTGECWIESATATTGIISGIVNDTNNTPISEAIVTADPYVSITNPIGGYILLDIPEGTYLVTASANGYNYSSIGNVTVTADSTTTVNFLLNASDEKAPTTTYTITPPPGEAGWNNATPVVVTFFRSSNNSSSGISHTNYSKVSATGPWTSVTTASAAGTDAENVTDITEGKFNLTVLAEGVTNIWYYSVNNNSVTETVKNVTVKIDTTTPPPATISDLQHTGGQTWINWSWTNPSDEDFSHVMLYLNGIWQTNTSDAYYNATNLAAETSYELSTRTVDTNGNVNTNWVNQTAATLAVPNSAPTAFPNGPYSGTEGVTTTFDGSASYDPDGSIISYEWDFGDGDAATVPNPTHNYIQDGAYTVILTVTDNDGAAGTNVTTATIADTGPTAEFYASTTTGPEPLTVSFSDSSTSYDNVTAWDWDFENDGAIDSTVQNPAHLYAEDGVYTVTLTIYESDGNSDTLTKVDYINVASVNQPPVAVLDAPETGTEGLPITFDGSASYDPDGSIISYYWNFGDENSSSSSEVKPTHTYALAGAYIVTLTVTDNEGATNATNELITIQPAANPVFSITITSPESRTYASTSVRMNVAVQPEGTVLDWIAYSLDSGTNVTTIPGSSTTTINSLSPGEHYLVVYAQDNNGNVAASNTVIFTLQPGDINGDTVINILDLQLLAWAFASQPGDTNWNEAADLNCDDKINILDYQIVAWNLT